MRHLTLIATIAFCAVVLPGCGTVPSGVNPSITVTSVQKNVLLISGKGFANVPLCAHLSIQGGTTGSISIGDPTCTNGAFSNFPFPYSYAGCVNPTSTTTATILAVYVDTQANYTTAAAQPTQIPWDKYCMLAKASCVNSGAACVACGGEGEPVCSNGSCIEPACTYAMQQNLLCVATQPDLHPEQAGTQVVCTANCGHTMGYQPCYPYMWGCDGSASSYPSTIIAPQPTCMLTGSNGLKGFSCFDDSTIDKNGQCICVPSFSTCPVNVSPGDGMCSPTKPC